MGAPPAVTRKYIMTRLVFLALAAAGFAADAAAQPVTGFTLGVSDAYTECNSAREARAQDAVALCEDAIALIIQLQTENPGVSLAEQDYAWFSLAGVYIELAGTYLQADGVRSARVCDASERSWSAVGSISASVEYPDAVASQNQTGQSVATVCRSEFGTPVWGRPLP
jgi:hypothetical protein